MRTSTLSKVTNIEKTSQPLLQTLPIYTTDIPRITNHLPCKVWDVITYQFSNLKGAVVMSEWVISPHNFPGVWLVKGSRGLVKGVPSRHVRIHISCYIISTFDHTFHCKAFHLLGPCNSSPRICVNENVKITTFYWIPLFVDILCFKSAFRVDNQCSKSILIPLSDVHMGYRKMPFPATVLMLKCIFDIVSTKLSIMWKVYIGITVLPRQLLCHSDRF